MKYIIPLILITSQLFIYSYAMSQNPPTNTDSIDLQKYSGKWYEIASYPMKFQKDCFCVTADYTLTDKGYVKVLNSCRKGSVKS